MQAFCQRHPRRLAGLSERDPGPGNALIKRDNPDMTDAIIAQAIDKMKRYELVIGGDGRAFGLGSMTDAHGSNSIDTMAARRALSQGPGLHQGL